MNEIETRRFNEAYQKFEAGDRVEGLRQLRDLAAVLKDPWDKTEILYHESLFLLELAGIAEARAQLEEFKGALASCDDLSSNDYQADRSIALHVMARFAEIKILHAEERDSDALRVAEELLSLYPERLSMPDFVEIRNEVLTHRALILTTLGRWGEAKPLLENASPPKAWKGLVAANLGECYYNFRDYERAKKKLVEALELGLLPKWEVAARYILGIVLYHLSEMTGAKREFEKCLQTGDPEYLRSTKIWDWLEATSLALGLFDEAERYRQRKTATPRVN